MIDKNFSFLEHPRLLFFFTFFAFLIGILAGYNLDTLWGLLSIIIYTIFVIMMTKKSRAILIFLVFSSFWWAYFSFSNAENFRLKSIEKIQEITQNFTQKVQINWDITSLLYTTDKEKIFRLQAKNIETSDKIYQFLKKDDIGFLVHIPKNLSLKTWDSFSFFGKIHPTISWKIEDFERFTWLKKWYAKIQAFQFEKIENTIPWWMQITENSKNFTKNLISKNFPRDHAAILLGITIWNTDFMNQSLKSDFKNSGLTHILVVSGSNIAFVILILTLVLRYFPFNRYIYYGIIFVFLWIYGHIVWWDTPVIRATIMGIISFLAIRWATKIQSISILFAIAWIFLIFNPLLLIYDASFGLSFFATLWILTFNESIHTVIKKYIPFEIISQSISVTLSATIWSAWMLIYHFGSIAIFGIFANIAIWAILWFLLIFITIYIFLSGFLLIFLHQKIVDQFDYFGGIIPYYITEYILWIAKFFASFESVTISKEYTGIVSLALYTIIFSYIFSKEQTSLFSKKIINP